MVLSALAAVSGVAQGELIAPQKEVGDQDGPPCSPGVHYGTGHRRRNGQSQEDVVHAFPMGQSKGDVAPSQSHIHCQFAGYQLDALQGD